MTNADKFKSIFGLYATELWAKPEKDFLEWLNADAELFGNSELMDDTISRRGAIKAIKDALLSWSNMPGWRDNKIVGALDKLPSAQPDIIRCKDCKYWTHIKRTNRYWCKTDDGLFDLNPSPDDFCSRAERRTDEQIW